TRSGQCAKCISFPQLKPASSNTGDTISDVVLGGIVDSTITVFPFSRTGMIDLTAFFNIFKSAVKFELWGVGTAIIYTSALTGTFLAEKLPFFTTLSTTSFNPFSSI